MSSGRSPSNGTGTANSETVYTGRLNTFGNPIVPQVERVREEHIKYKQAVEDVKRLLVEAQSKVKSWKNKQFAYLKMRPICRSALDHNPRLVAAEFGIVIFSFNEGIVASHNGLFEIDTYPFFEKGEIKLNCSLYGLPTPEEPITQMRMKPTHMMDLLKELTVKHDLFLDGKYLFFVARDEVRNTRSSLNWVQDKAGTKIDVRFIDFEILVMAMSQKAGNVQGVCNNAGGAGKFVLATNFDYMESLACQWHQESCPDKIDKCCLSIARCRVYNTLYYLCHLFKKEIAYGTHTPLDQETAQNANDFCQPSRGAVLRKEAGKKVG